MNEEALSYKQAHDDWQSKYSPEWLEYDKEGGPNFLRAKSTPNEFVWTAHGTCEDAMITSGFKFFGDPPRCCWDTFGWYISKISSGNTTEDKYESYRLSMYTECDCFNDETEEGKLDCNNCSGEGWITHWFDE